MNVNARARHKNKWFCRSLTPDRFAQIDLILASKQWRNAISDVHAHTNIAFDSDHVFVTADVRIKLSVSKQPEKGNGRSKRIFNPTQEQVDNYNQHFQSNFIFKQDPLEDNWVTVAPL